MRFYTRAWFETYTDQEAAIAAAAYRQRLEEIAPHLSPGLHTLADLSLHDAKFLAFAIDQPMRRVALQLRCGDLQQGYFDLTLRYAEASCLDATPYGLASLLNDPKVEVLYGEVDTLDHDRFEHRLILWPAGEVTIQFAALRLVRADVAARDAPPSAPLELAATPDLEAGFTRRIT